MTARRRAFLALLPVSAVPATAAGLPQPSPDADLIRLCHAFDDLEGQIQALYEDGATPIADDEERKAAIEPLRERQAPILDQICALRAITPEGVRARAWTLRKWDVDLMSDGHQGDTNERLMLALILDLTGDR
ncbi:hypothetical protein CTJ15_03730 (plasmid) [Roseomonas sp. FDAARGOS_362]|uniref:hypothetical protein n=1 Tax=Roseomonas sp. FDAARGOS_362 TaxID=2018065 RepID=UPI000C18DC89|nr:hypothetical protein [Roseomonas sp. FDAARGOS_362]ATR19486.1 hypothetical protein CTJ15_03730 [Roseomonas sp. FDAARGOS_362]